MAVDVKPNGTTIETGIPRPLFQTRNTGSDFTNGKYDVTPDGERFLVLQPPASEPSAVPPIAVVVNWLAATQKK